MSETAYINATIINGSKEVDTIEKGVIVVDDEYGKIINVTNSKDIYLTGYKIVDLEGLYIMPGLINAHLHLFSSGKPTKEVDGRSQRFQLWLSNTWLGKKILYKIYLKNVLTNLNAGVTTIRDVGSFHNFDLIMKSEISKGKIEGPRVLCSGDFIIPTAGHAWLSPTKCVADNPWEGRKQVRKLYHRGVDWIKICNTGGVGDSRFIGEAGMPHMTVEEIEAICDEAHRRNLMVASHCESTQGMWDALNAGVDTIEHGSFIPDEMVPLFLDNPKTLRGYTSLIPTISAAFCAKSDKLAINEKNRILIANSKIVLEGSQNAAKQAYKHGIKMGVGNDAGVPGVRHYNLYEELIAIQNATGASEKDIIDIATVQTAKILNIADITGSIDIGKSADFIVMSKNPLENLQHIYKPTKVCVRGKFIQNPAFQEV